MKQGVGSFFKFKGGMRKLVGIHQGRERGDVLLTIVLPLVLMLVSAYTNAWAFTGGNLSFATWDLAINTIDALVRGLFVEALVFSCFMMVRVLCLQGKWWVAVSSIFPALFGLMGVMVSAGCGLAWVAKSGQMDWMIHTVSMYLPPVMAKTFQVGLGLLFPSALAIYALYDIRHLINEHVKRGSEMGSLATIVESAEHHQNMLREAQQEADESMKPYYKQIAQANAQQAVDSAKKGDLSFGMDAALNRQTQQLQQARTSVTPISAPAPQLQLPAGGAPGPQFFPPQQPPAFQQPPINAQFGPAPMQHSGGTIPLQMPPQNGGMMPPSAPPAPGGMMPPLPPNQYRNGR